MNTIKFIAPYDADWNRFLEFEVPYDWAVSYCGGEEELEEFRWTYDGFDSEQMYSKAILDGVVITEVIVEG